MIELIPLGTLTMKMAPPVVLPVSPAGTRVIVEFPEIAWQGERLRAHRKGATAADWLHVGPEDTATLDFRFVLETDDGAAIYVQGAGRTDARTFNQGGAVYFTPRFECASPAYAWLNKVQAVAKGSAADGQVVFEVYELR